MGESIRFDIEFRPNEVLAERDAKIFEAGDYPDKGIVITKQDLDDIIKRFQSAPVMIEHMNTPLDPLGWVKRIWRKGDSLFGNLTFPKEIAEFLDKRGIKKLSVAINKNPLSLSEVSLVLNPRVQSAAIFNQKSILMEDSENMENEEKGYQQMVSELREMKFAIKCKEVDEKIAALRLDGKLIPASEVYAREILLKGDGKISFADNIFTVSELFERFLETQPKVITFDESAAADMKSPMKMLSDKDEEMIAKLGISQEQLEKYLQ